jgi:hypothetical protein
MNLERANKPLMILPTRTQAMHCRRRRQEAPIKPGWQRLQLIRVSSRRLLQNSRVASARMQGDRSAFMIARQRLGLRLSSAALNSGWFYSRAPQDWGSPKPGGAFAVNGSPK